MSEQHLNKEQFNKIEKSNIYKGTMRGFGDEISFYTLEHKNTRTFTAVRIKCILRNFG